MKQCEELKKVREVSHKYEEEEYKTVNGTKKKYKYNEKHGCVRKIHAQMRWTICKINQKTQRAAVSWRWFTKET